MNKRTISIIQELCIPEKPVSISELAGQFGVSQRTIRNDLNTINDILKRRITFGCRNYLTGWTQKRSENDFRKH